MSKIPMKVKSFVEAAKRAEVEVSPGDGHPLPGHVRRALRLGGGRMSTIERLTALMGEPASTGASATLAAASSPRRWCPRARTWNGTSGPPGRTRVSSSATTTVLRDYAGRPSALTECAQPVPGTRVCASC